ncbi:hypothetical protein D9757_001567 [Collybiopsis confluens]|uniref:Nudix hydrolase domain-containing protein n=1 Tax=Collybiopsis confluens TaxID=2823264 RepID=A0A8H5HZN6_9AGAR|nr:hypothetical protein D9757_001567 [Collybiopsis confluens]
MTNPEQHTALPGGRVDEEDKDAIETAFREANEEVTLPFPLHLRSKSLAVSGDTPTTPHIHTLCTLSPHLSQWGLVVTPVVIAFLSSPSPTESAHAYLQSTLRANPDEVDCIFTHPLEAFLDPTLLADPTFLSGDSETRDSIKLAPKESEDWPYEEEYYTSTDRVQPELGNTVYRMHRFRSTASPIKGLTAEILMRVATIAYNKPPALPIEQYAPGQVVGFDQITRVLRMNEGAKTRDSD